MSLIIPNDQLLHGKWAENAHPSFADQMNSLINIWPMLIIMNYCHIYVSDILIRIMKLIIMHLASFSIVILLVTYYGRLSKLKHVVSISPSPTFLPQTDWLNQVPKYSQNNNRANSCIYHFQNWFFVRCIYTRSRWLPLWNSYFWSSLAFFTCLWILIFRVI